MLVYSHYAENKTIVSQINKAKITTSRLAGHKNGKKQKREPDIHSEQNYSVRFNVRLNVNIDINLDVIEGSETLYISKRTAHGFAFI